MKDEIRSMDAASERLLRLSQIIGPNGLIPVGKSTWWQGVKDGYFPKPIKIGRRVTVWRQSEIEALIAFRSEGGANVGDL